MITAFKNTLEAVQTFTCVPFISDSLFLNAELCKITGQAAFILLTCHLSEKTPNLLKPSTALWILACSMWQWHRQIIDTSLRSIPSWSHHPVNTSSDVILRTCDLANHKIFIPKANTGCELWIEAMRPYGSVHTRGWQTTEREQVKRPYLKHVNYQTASSFHSCCKCVVS